MKKVFTLGILAMFVFTIMSTGFVLADHGKLTVTFPNPAMLVDTHNGTPGVITAPCAAIKGAETSTGRVNANLTPGFSDLDDSHCP